ncbi:AMP-binding protein [Dehalococcoidia bacterium]|nr:AMP-binding protein [Dehalococcoidia bacterium]
MTIPKVWLEKCRRYGSRKVAMREKEFGIWLPYTWQDYYDNVKSFCLGMKALGLERGETVAFIGSNRPHALWAEMAALCAGAIPTWLFKDSLLDETEYIVRHAEARFYIAEGQEEVDKGLWIRERCPKLERIIWEDPKGMRYYKDPVLISYGEVQQMGQEYERGHPGIFEEMIAEGKADDTCLIFYTSGTTALPKGAVLTHRNMLSMGRNLLWVDPGRPQIRAVRKHLRLAFSGSPLGLRPGAGLTSPLTLKGRGTSFSNLSAKNYNSLPSIL